MIFREKEEREQKKYQAKQKNDSGRKNGDNNLSDPETSKRNRVGKRQSERLKKQSRGSGHQRSFSLPGRNPGQNKRNQRWERQPHNNDYQLDPTGNNFMDPSWDEWNGGYDNHHHNQWTIDRGFPMVNRGYGDNFQNPEFYQPYYDNGPYDMHGMHGQYEGDSWTIDRRGMKESADPNSKVNSSQSDFHSDPNFPHELMNSSGFPEKTWKWGEPAQRYHASHHKDYSDDRNHGNYSGDRFHGNFSDDRYHEDYSVDRHQDNFPGRGRSSNRWSRNNKPRDNFRRDDFRDKDFKNPNNLPQNSHKLTNGQNKDNDITNSKQNERPHDKPSTSKIDVRSKVTDEPLSGKKPTSEKCQETTRETRNRSESSEKVSNKRRRYDSPSRSLERKSRQDREPRNTHIRFADEEKSRKHGQLTDEAESSGDKEDVSSSSSGKKGGGGSKEKKKGILKKKKKNGGKGSPPGSPKRTSKKGREDKGGEGVLEKAEKLCRELREKREKAKLERERKMKMEQQEKLENINQELKTLSDKSKEYVKGHILTEEKKEPGVSSVKASEEKKTSESNVTKLGQSNKEIEKIRQNIEKSVQGVREIQRLQSSSWSEGNSVKKDLNSSSSKSGSANSEKSGKETGKRETSTKLNSVETKKVGLREEMSGAAPKKSKEKPNTEVLLKMVNSPRSRKERKQLAEMLRSYAQSQKKLSLPRYNLQLSGSYDDQLDERIEELRLEELSPEVQIQIAQLMEAEATPDLNDLEKALMTSSDQGKNHAGNSRKDNSLSINSSPVSVVDPYLKGDKAIQRSSKEQLRSLSTDSDKGRPLGRRNEDADAAQPLKMSDLQRPSIPPREQLSDHRTTVIPKSEPMDLEYEKASQKPSPTPEIATSHVSSTTNIGETDKIVPSHSSPVPRVPLFSDQLPQRSSTQIPVSAALPSLSGMI